MNMKEQMFNCLQANLDYWVRTGVDRDKQIILTLGCDNKPLQSGKRSAVLTARVLWTFSAAYKIFNKPEWKEMADIAYADICNNFIDKEYGGVFDRGYPDGSVDTDKMWWEESESVTGLIYGWKLSGDEALYKKAESSWKFIVNHIAGEDGRWNWKVTKEGKYIPVTDPSSPLICPYHSGRVVVLCADIL